MCLFGPYMNYPLENDELLVKEVNGKVVIIVEPSPIEFVLRDKDTKELLSIDQL